jgi:GTP pyrophosphokinase
MAKPEEEKMMCWQVYSIVTDIYTPNPERLRDWVSIPKANGYESLHTTVASPKGRWVEVQIRTERMNEVAEKGLAAHWKYKGGKLNRNLDEWLKNMREVLDSLEIEPGDYDNQLKQTLYTGEIFVFTPKGDLKRLPKGATVLDFAFEIHSEVGLKCVGGKVNHKNVSIKHPLKNGDMVEITTSKNQKAKTDWLKFVITSKAKSKIKQSLNEEKLREADIGKEILKRRLRNWKINFSDATVKKLLKHYDLKYAQDLYYLISQEKIILGNIKEFLQRDSREITDSNNDPRDLSGSPDLSARPDQSEDFLVIDGKIENVDYHLAKCCKPVIGNKIFGFVTINEGIKIHRMDCPNAPQLISKYPYRVIQVKWSDSSKQTVFDVKLKISGDDEMGVVNHITDVITRDLKVNMHSVRFKTMEAHFEGEVSLKILNKDHLDIITRKLMKIKGVTKVVKIT